jgi:hypothetical protein
VNEPEIQISSDGRRSIPVILDVTGWTGPGESDLGRVQVYLSYDEARAVGEALITHGSQPMTVPGEPILTIFRERDHELREEPE